MNKAVLITGANHGLGLSLVNVFLENGFLVFAGVYNLNSDSQINTLKDNDNLYLFNMDIADINTIKEAARFVGGITQSIDILINNAGIIPYDENQVDKKTILNELDFESINNAINVNAVGALRVANVFSQLLLNSVDKLLVNISSEAGSISNCERDIWFGYCMSKAALNMAGAIMHNELKKHNGQVVQIDPGYMQTYMHGEKNDNATYSPDFSAQNIFEQIKNMTQCRSEKVMFIDLFGNELDW